MPAAAQLRVPLLAARLAGQVALERIRPTEPRGLTDIPVSAEVRSTAWLTEVMCREVPGASVNGVEVVGGSDGTSSRRALRLTYNAAGRDAGLREAIFVKSASSYVSRLFLVVSHVTESETIFFNRIRPELDGLRSPAAFHAASDSRACRSIAVMEDKTAEGWSFPDPMREEISRRDAEDMVDEMAYYHAAFWLSPRLKSEFGLPSSQLFQQRLNDIGIVRRAEIGVDRGIEVMPARLRARRRELIPATMEALRINSSAEPETLLHQDVHQGNWLRDAEGRMGLYDWQAVARGGWALDVSYAMAVNLTIENRREWERGLLERYLGRLEELGIAAPSFDDAWLQFRRQPFHVVIFAALTIGAGRFQPEMQPRDYMLRCWERITAFVDDHDSLDALN